MTPRWIAAFAALTLVAPGCQQAPEATPEAKVVPKAEAKPVAEKAAAKPAPKAAAKPAPKAAAKPAPKAAAKPAPKAAPKPASRLVAWDAPLAWMDWDAGLAKAKAEKKPIMLLVYADW